MTNRRIHPEFEAWRDIPSSITSDCLERFAAMSGELRSLSGNGVVGPAHTLRTTAGDNLSIHAELTSVARGSVLVIDAGGYRDRAVWGGVLMTAALSVGIIGVVIDGSVRDIDQLRESEFPVYARGTSPAGPFKTGGGIGGTTISCGGVVVNQGDLIVADGDGVTVVATTMIEQTLESALARIALEETWVDQINSGVSSMDALKLNTRKN